RLVLIRDFAATLVRAATVTLCARIADWPMPEVASDTARTATGATLSAGGVPYKRPRGPPHTAVLALGASPCSQGRRTPYCARMVFSRHGGPRQQRRKCARFHRFRSPVNQIHLQCGLRHSERNRR